MAFLGFLRKNKVNKHSPAVDLVSSGEIVGINEALRRIESKQKEMGLLLEDIDEFIQGGQPGGADDGQQAALIAILDLIFDFYTYSKSNPGLEKQGGIMWNAAVNAAAGAGIGVVCPENSPFDFNLHNAQERVFNEDTPVGYVVRTLICGYVNNDITLRRAAVVVSGGKQTTIS